MLFSVSPSDCVFTCVTTSVCALVYVCVWVWGGVPYAHPQSTAACSFLVGWDSFPGGFERKHHFHRVAIYLWDENITASGSRQNMCLAKASWLDTKIRGGGADIIRNKKRHSNPTLPVWRCVWTYTCLITWISWQERASASVPQSNGCHSRGRGRHSASWGRSAKQGSMLIWRQRLKIEMQSNVNVVQRPPSKIKRITALSHVCVSAGRLWWRAGTGSNSEDLLYGGQGHNAGIKVADSEWFPVLLCQ